MILNSAVIFMFDLCPEIVCIGGQRLLLKCYHEAQLKTFERDWNDRIFGWQPSPPCVFVKDVSFNNICSVELTFYLIGFLLNNMFPQTLMVFFLGMIEKAFHELVY